MDGNKRGRTIGFPTANVAVWDEQVIPANGVYACRVHLGDETFNAVTNVGVRPTFDGENVTVEAHIFDFDRDIYGQTLAVDFVERLRGEQKFDGIEARVAQIKQDAEQARVLLG
jgi:riboflavin kinase/FMN adenylyltransferase